MRFALNLQYGYYFLDLKESHVERLKLRFPSIEFCSLEKKDERFLEVIREAEAFATRPFKIESFNRMLENAKKLQWIQFSYVGVAPEYLKLARERNWIVTNARGIASESLALHALSFILAFERGLFQAFECQKERKWDHKFFTALEHGFEGVRGKVLGIIGLGSIGKSLAEKGHALGMRVLGIKKNPHDSPPFVEKVFSPSSLSEFLREADFVVLCLPLLEETVDLIGKNEISRMKKSAYLINVARGGLVEEMALIQALREHRIAGAALDVAKEEPLPSSSPLYDVPNLVLTPHIAGLDRYYTDHLVDLISENLQNFIEGKPLKNQVDLTQGY